LPDPSRGVYFIDKEDVNQSNVEIVGLGTDRRNPDVPALAVMNEILGGSFASRMFQKIRTEQGLAYAVGGSYGYGWDHPGTFHAMVLTQSATTVDATKLALAEIDGLTTRLTEEELARAKDNILNSFLFRYDTREKVLAMRVRLEFYGYPSDYLENYRAALEKVTIADLDRVAKKYIHPGKLAILVVGNGPEIKPGLDELKLGGAGGGHYDSDAETAGGARTEVVSQTKNGCLRSHFETWDSCSPDFAVSIVFGVRWSSEVVRDAPRFICCPNGFTSFHATDT